MDKSHSGRIKEWSCNHLNNNNPREYSLFGLPFVTGMPSTSKPTTGLLTLRAEAADTGELRTILRSAALLVFFDREQTWAGDFSQQWDMIFSPMSWWFVVLMLQGTPVNDSVVQKRGICMMLMALIFSQLLDFYIFLFRRRRIIKNDCRVRKF